MNACQVTRQDHPQRGSKKIQQWVEVWDYTSDAIYRGFVTDTSGEQTLFVFFEESTLGYGLKNGYVYASLLTFRSFKSTNPWGLQADCSV